MIPNTIIVIILVYFESMLLPTIEGYVQFLIAGFIIVIINGGVLYIFNLIINKSITIEVLNRTSGLINKKYR